MRKRRTRSLGQLARPLLGLLGAGFKVALGILYACYPLLGSSRHARRRHEQARNLIRPRHLSPYEHAVRPRSQVPRGGEVALQLMFLVD